MDPEKSPEPFIWRKMYEEKGVNIDDPEVKAKVIKDLKKKIKEREPELQKIRERTERRELEYQQKLRDAEFLQRQKESREHEDWKEKEDQFMFKQHRQGSRNRIKLGNAKPIDYFVHYNDIFGVSDDTGHHKHSKDSKIYIDDSPVELTNPCTWFNGMTQTDLEALEKDIRVYLKADSKENREYWQNLLDITLNEAIKLKSVKERFQRIHPLIGDHVSKLFKNKTVRELAEMEDEIKDILRSNSNDPVVDKTIYKEVLSRLRAYRASEQLLSNHHINMKRVDTDKRRRARSNDRTSSIKEEAGEGEGGQELKEQSSKMDEEDKDYEQGTETKFSCEMQVATKRDNRRHAEVGKYQARKPLYSNTVRTGFEWNKYNKTHYDIDNPPPRVVQGYKFNIFYPDLIDKSKAPQFSITPCEEDKDFCMIRFSAGPPYEDIAFKIVNREWNTSNKVGYKCQFTGNTLQLYFRFKRYRYRR